MESMAKKLSELEGEMYDINLRCTQLEKDRNNNVIELGKHQSVISLLEARLKKIGLDTSSQRASSKKRRSKKRRSKKRRSKKRRS